MKTRITAWACVLALSGCAAPSDRAATPPMAPQEATIPQGDLGTAQAEAGQATVITGGRGDRSDVRCVDTAITGSRIARRICLTEAEWERWRMDSQELLREWQGPKTGAR